MVNKKISKRSVLLIAVIIALSLLVFAACGNKEPEVVKPTITNYKGDIEFAMDDLVWTATVISFKDTDSFKLADFEVEETASFKLFPTKECKVEEEIKTTTVPIAKSEYFLKVYNTTTPIIYNVYTLRFNPQPFEISFDTQGGEAISSLTKYYGDKFEDEIPQPYRSGYAFVGWYTSATGSTPYTKTAVTTKNPADYKLFAKWTEPFVSGDFTYIVSSSKAVITGLTPSGREAAASENGLTIGSTLQVDAKNTIAVSGIAPYAFKDETNLSKLNITASSLLTLGAHAFYGIKDLSISVPEALAAAYLGDAAWAEWTHFVDSDLVVRGMIGSGVGTGNIYYVLNTVTEKITIYRYDKLKEVEPNNGLYLAMVPSEITVDGVVYPVALLSQFVFADNLSNPVGLVLGTLPEIQKDALDRGMATTFYIAGTMPESANWLKYISVIRKDVPNFDEGPAERGYDVKFRQDIPGGEYAAFLVAEGYGEPASNNVVITEYYVDKIVAEPQNACPTFTLDLRNLQVLNIVDEPITEDAPQYDIVAIAPRGFSYVEGIDENAEKTKVSRIILPDSIETIGESAFIGLSELKDVDLGSVVEIGESAFEGCLKLDTIDFGSKLERVGARAFYGIYETVVKQVGEAKYTSYKGIKSITLPASVRYIGESAFENIKSLETLRFASNGNLAYIGASAFKGCGAVTIDSDGKTVLNNGITSLAIPASVAYIGEAAFQNLSALTTLNFAQDSQLVYLGDYAFSGCVKVNSQNQTSQSSNSMNLYELKRLQYIGANAFYNVGRDAATKSKATLSIPNSVKEIGNYAFYGCAYFEAINFYGMGEPQLTSIGKNAFEGTNLKGALTIPAKVQSIGDYAFSKLKGITSLKFASKDTLQRIGASAFSNCGIVGTVEIPSSVKMVGDGAFSYCGGITEFKIDKEAALEEIGPDAFSRTGIKTFTITKNVKRIGGYAFAFCKGLTNIFVYPATPPRISGNKELVFLNTNINNGGVYIEDAYFSDYKSDWIGVVRKKKMSEYSA